MSPTRESEVLAHIPTLGSVEECRGFREQLRVQGEQLTTAIYRDLLARIDTLAKREGRA